MISSARGDNITFRLAKILFHIKARNTQVGNGEAPARLFGLRTTRPVAPSSPNFAAGTGRRPRLIRRWRLGGYAFRPSSECARAPDENRNGRYCGRRSSAPPRILPSPRHCLYRREHIVRRVVSKVFLIIFKQRLRLRFTVDNPVGIKNLVAAVLGFARANMYNSISFRVAPSLVNASCK